MEAPHKKERIPQTIRDLLPFPGPTSPTEEVTLEKCHVKIGATLERTMLNKLLSLLQKNEDLFAWDLKDLKGVSCEIAEHKLEVTLGIQPACQKLQLPQGERKEAASTEVTKL